MKVFDPSLRGIIQKNRRKDSLFVLAGFLVLLVSLMLLSFLVGDLFTQGFHRIDWAFIHSFPSRFAQQAGILSAWVGTLAVIVVTGFLAVPVGIGAGIYLEEYSRKDRFSYYLELNIANLAAVPSILFGLLALGIFVHALSLGSSIITAALTLSLLILPIIIVATREAIRSVPQSLREAAFALGATKWEVVRDHVLPSSFGSILTGIIIALSRAIGETAPLVTIGALTFIAFLPQAPLTGEFPFLQFAWLKDPFTVLPIQIFNWVSRPQEEFHVNAAAAGVVLLVLTLGLNLTAILLRSHLRRKAQW